MCKNMARIESSRQQAYYNACSGVEYAKFIIEHSPAIYDPLDPTDASGKNPWPKGTSFQCFDDSEQGTATISIITDGAGGYNLSSTGTLGTITATTNAHYLGGKIEEWN